MGSRSVTVRAAVSSQAPRGLELAILGSVFSP